MTENRTETRAPTPLIEPYKLSEIFSIVPEYDGNPIILQTFIHACNQAYCMAVADQKSLLLVHIKNKLRGKAAEVVNSRNPNTWPEIKSLLESHFGDARDLTSLIQDLQRLHQLNNESPLTFISRLQTHNAKMHSAIQKQYLLNSEQKEAQSCLIETMALNTLLTGLEPNLGKIVRAGNPPSILEAINRVKRELQLSYFESQKFNKPIVNRNPIQTQPKRSSIPQKICSFCHRNGHTINECRTRQNQQFTPSNSMPNAYSSQAQFSRPSFQNFSNQNNQRQSYPQNSQQPSNAQQTRPSVIRPNPNFQQRFPSNQQNPNFNRQNPQRTHHVNFDNYYDPYEHTNSYNEPDNFNNPQFDDSQNCQINYNDQYLPQGNYCNNWQNQYENYTANSQMPQEDYTANPQDFRLGTEYPVDTPTQEPDPQIDELSNQVQTMNINDNLNPYLNFPEQGFM